MNKYIETIKNTWTGMFIYRLNFTMWRIRVIFQLLTMYFLWLTLIPSGQKILGYSQSMMLTYILGVSFVGSVVLSTRTHEIGDNINNGDLSVFLIRPINYFLYWFSKDIGDKLMNITFSLIELSLLFFILRPPLFFQANMSFVALSILAVFLGMLLYFFIGAILGLFGFWTSEIWAPRFILFIVINFFAGGLFPLDILPENIYRVFQFIPFSYLLYFPIKIYFGKLTFHEIYFGICICTMWIGICYLILRYMWMKGLRLYTAYGR